MKKNTDTINVHVPMMDSLIFLSSDLVCVTWCVLFVFECFLS
jgi:hypothetical protein